MKCGHFYEINLYCALNTSDLHPNLFSSGSESNKKNSTMKHHKSWNPIQDINVKIIIHTHTHTITYVNVCKVFLYSVEGKIQGPLVHLKEPM